jgi:hypothetical protein
MVWRQLAVTCTLQQKVDHDDVAKMGGGGGNKSFPIVYPEAG